MVFSEILEVVASGRQAVQHDVRQQGCEEDVQCCQPREANIRWEQWGPDGEGACQAASDDALISATDRHPS